MDKTPMIDPEWRHKFVPTTDGVQLHYVEAGPSDALPVVMVHGWPDLWFGWRVRGNELGCARRDEGWSSDLFVWRDSTKCAY
jgi:pimeloyl-ACP methyl ester carboxylesterase